MNGVSPPVVARRLGHGNVRRTMRYAHVGDREVEVTAERVGQAIAAMIGVEEPERARGNAGDAATGALIGVRSVVDIAGT